MKTIGRVRVVCAKEEGQSASGNFWEKQTLVVDIASGERDIPIAICYFGERRTAWLKGLKPGDLVSVVFAPESREYNGKWYTELVGFGVKRYTPESNSAPQEAVKPGDPRWGEMPPSAPVIADGADDLPF